MLKQDKVLMSLLFGAVSTIPFELVTRISLFLGYSKYTLYQLDSLTVTANRPDLFLGILSSCQIGAFGSAIFYIIITKTNSYNIIIKTIFFSLLMWSVLEYSILGKIEGVLLPLRPVTDYYFQSIGAIVFGITLGILLKKFVFMDTTSDNK